MEGLEVSIISFSGLNLGDRADAEYFSKENRAIEQALRNHDALHLREFGTLVSSAFYPAATDLYEEGDVPFARCTDCIEYPIITQRQDSRFVRVPSWFVKQSKQIDCANRYDIIITKVGSPCFASIIHDYDYIALSRTVLGLVQIHDINPYYLTAFLRCRFGFKQLLRQREQTIQFQLTLERVRDVLVYRASPKFQNAIEKLMLGYVASIEEVYSKADEAESTLTAALGLGNWQPPEPLTYTRRASEAFLANRFDAEYFHPAKKAFLDQLSALPGKPLQAYYRAVREMFDPNSAKAGDIVRNYDLTNALQPVLDDEQLIIPAREVGSAKKCFIAGDVVISRLRAYLREIALVRTSPSVSAVGSSEFIVLRPHDSKNPVLSRAALLVFLRSHPVQTILKWSQDGSHHPRFGDEDLMFIPVPDAVCAVTPEIDELFEHVLVARSRAHALLDAAKRAVEIAIEQSEAAALAFLKDRLQF